MRAALFAAACVAAASLLPAVAQAPVPSADNAEAPISHLVPLGDETEVPLFPAAISRSDVEAHGRYLHIWSEPDNTQVIQYHGDFALEVGARRLKSDEAVIWMRPAAFEERNYYQYDIYLARRAQVTESGGTVVTAPALFVTLNSFRPPELLADASTRASPTDSELYRQAAGTRETMGTSEVTTRPAEMSVVDLTAPEPLVPPEPGAVIRYRGKEQVYDDQAGLLTVIGNVYLSQGTPDSGAFLELRADTAVVFFAKREEPPPEEHEVGPPPQPGTAPGATPGGVRTPPPGIRDQDDERVGGELGLGAGIGRRVVGVYLEGDVVMTRGEQMIRSPKVYYDFENSRALILDSVARTIDPQRNLPVYVRAEQMRQLSQTEFVATKARVSTSEFYTPHVHIGAEKLYLIDRTRRDVAGRIAGIEAGQFRLEHGTFNVEGVPILYWPYAQGDFRRTETSLKSARFAYSDDFGATVQTKWYLMNLLGMEAPEGVDATLRLDEFSERGPGVGIDVDYEREDYYGLFRGYYIHDTGEDNLGGFRNDLEPDSENRGRLTWRHRHYLPDDWELTLELSYISDPGFLEEYFEQEFDEGKEQETLVYLKKQRDNWALTALAQWRILDYVTQTEHLPDVAFHWIGEPIGEIASFFSETHVGAARFRPDDRRLSNDRRFLDNTERTDVTFRSETREEIDVPIKLGAFNIVPYATGRAGYWDGGARDGAGERVFGSVGLRGATQFWKFYKDVQSRLLDLNGVRHIISPEVVAWLAGSNRDSIELHPFDPSVEGIDDFSGATLLLRQRWQTKRGGPGRWRVVDWITLDLALTAIADSAELDPPIGRTFFSRPENSSGRGNFTGDLTYRISDTTTILSNFNYDLDDGHMDLVNISYVVERSPRFSYAFGLRRIHETDSNLFGFGANYKVNEKHTLAFRNFFDIDRGKTEEVSITVVRKFPRWYAAVTFELDRVEDEFGISLAVWPEGAPQAALGRKRFTGLATSTGIRPE